ncbi:MAG: sterol desaturase family protein, partial [Candidatus Puniceispirillaceae bacterium]
MSDNNEHKAPRSEWHFHPDLPIGNNPLFEFPWSLSKIITYHRDYWLTISEVSFFLVLSIMGWFAHQAALSQSADLSISWAAQIYLRNFIITIIVAGGLHHALYKRKSQNTDTKYIAAFLHRGGAKFTFGNQLYDNMFYSLISGVLIWSAYEAFLLWSLASGHSQSLSLAVAPFLFIVILLFTGVWVAFHFYLVHRLLHWGILYDLVHSLHHRNVNVGPWSGISMHPVEHALYFSSMLIHLVIPSHPVHIMFHGYMLALSAIIGHAGFHELLVGKSRRIALGHFHHQLHHRYFECNYGSVDFPMDVWFGTFHDGTEDAKKRLKNR